MKLRRILYIGGLRMNKHKNDDLTYLVEAAKQNSRAADLLIGQYMPFIRAEAAKFLRRAASTRSNQRLPRGVVTTSHTGKMTK